MDSYQGLRDPPVFGPPDYSGTSGFSPCIRPKSSRCISQRLKAKHEARRSSALDVPSDTAGGRLQRDKQCETQASCTGLWMEVSGKLKTKSRALRDGRPHAGLEQKKHESAHARVARHRTGIFSMRHAEDGRYLKV